MKRVLLTGASGFVGRHCLEPLAERGYEIHAVSCNHRALTEADVHWHQVDLLDPQQVNELLRSLEPTHMLHSAWYAVPGKYWEAPENHQWVDASLHLFRTFAKAGGRRAVGVGTCAEYDWSHGRCTEFSTPLNPTSTYGACKNKLRAGLEELAGESDLSIAWGRLFFLYGPHERPERFVPSMINAVLKGNRAQCSHGQQIRDYIYVKDAAAAFISLLDSRVSGPVNIASGKDVTLNQIARTIGARLGRTDLVAVAETEDNGPVEIVADTARLNTEVGWLPQYDLALGLEETISWWKRNQ